MPLMSMGIKTRSTESFRNLIWHASLGLNITQQISYSDRCHVLNEYLEKEYVSTICYSYMPALSIMYTMLQIQE